MKLYHGSNVLIEQIDLTKSKEGKDFGKGFYLSADRQQAEQMAAIKTKQMDSGLPIVTVYDFDEACLTDGSLKVKVFDSYSKEWAEFVFINRSQLSNNSGYDLIIGPIADDKVGVQLRRFMLNYIDIDRFIENLKYAKGMTIQYFFETEKAINQLKKV